MSTNTESTSNSIKFAPMPMSALLASLAPLRNKPKSRDSSFSSGDESDHSFGETVAKKPSPVKSTRKETISHEIKKELFTPNSKDFHLSTVEKKVAPHDFSNKENIYNHGSNRTYPNKDSQCDKSAQKQAVLSVYPNSERKRNVLIPHNNNMKVLDSVHKRTPEIKVPNSVQKTKTPTPKIKSGIRRFTPGSHKKSQKKTPQKLIVEPNKETFRCLFPESHSKPQREERCPPPQVRPPVPETPLNKKPISVSHAATPSYPQGAVGNNSKAQFKTTVIKGKKYMYIKKLGTGGSSEVYKVLEVTTSCEYAIKFVDLATDQELAQGYINEVRLLRELQDSDRVIRLYDYEYDRSNQYLRVVLEVGETDLSSFLKARGAGLPPALVLHYWEEMLLAVNYIHKRGVIHADLKPANFLLVCGRLKLIDFGIASAVNSDATSVVRAQATGTFSYISPEALVGGAGGHSPQPHDNNAPIKISFRSDVWSLGCILYSMVYGRTPFAHIPNFGKLAAILDPNHRIDYPPVEHLPASLLAALQWCLTYNSRARPHVPDLLAIKYLQPAAAAGTPLPQPLLEKLRHVVSPQEYRLLLQAKV